MESFTPTEEPPKTLEFKSDETEVFKSPPPQKANPRWKAIPTLPAPLEPLPIQRGRRPPGHKLHIRQPFKILTDIWGVLISHNFRTELFTYLEANQARYLAEHFDDPTIKKVLAELFRRTREEQQAKEYADMPTIDETQLKEVVVAACAENLNYRRAHKDSKVLMSSFEVLNNHIWNDGYASKQLRPHLFSDVLANFKRWRDMPFYVKIYTFASGPPDVQKLFLSACDGGDPSRYVVAGFDAYHRYKYDPSKYRGVLASLDERDPRNLFYFTDSPKKAQAARTAGMTPFVVLRDGNRNYREEALAPFPLLQSFDELDFYEFGGGCC